MTGRELIIYILKNNLEDEDLLNDGFSELFMTPEEAAVKWKCGPATVKAFIDLKKVKGIRFNNTYYVLTYQENPLGKEKLL